MTRAYAGGLADFDEGMRDGSLLRGEVLARWQDFVGTGDLMRSLESRVGRLRDRVGRRSFTGRRARRGELRDALESGVEALISGAADGAAERSLDALVGRARRAGPCSPTRRGRHGAGSAGPPPTCASGPRRRSGAGRGTCSTWSATEGAEQADHGPDRLASG